MHSIIRVRWMSRWSHHEPRERAARNAGLTGGCAVSSAVNLLGVDVVVTRPSRLRRAAIRRRSGIRHTQNIGRELYITRSGLGSMLPTSLNEVRTGHPEGLYDPFHGYPPEAATATARLAFFPAKSQKLNPLVPQILINNFSTQFAAFLSPQNPLHPMERVTNFSVLHALQQVAYLPFIDF